MAVSLTLPFISSSLFPFPALFQGLRLQVRLLLLRLPPLPLPDLQHRPLGRGGAAAIDGWMTELEEAFCREGGALM